MTLTEDLLCRLTACLGRTFSVGETGETCRPTLATFNDHPADAAWARRMAQMHITACTTMFLRSGLAQIAQTGLAFRAQAIKPNPYVKAVR